MTFDLTSPLPKETVFLGKRWKLRLSFDVVLRVFALYRDEVLYGTEKQALALALLVENSNPPTELLEHIFEEYISITKKSDRKRLKCFDFLQDGAYLYASFLMDYGIDLTQECGRLHWWKFVALFQGLSERTKMREVMRIRQEPIPEPNKHNGKYIENLIALKNYYALEISQEEREQNFRSGIASLAQVLKARASS
ncbi:MAG: hypothetical protein IKL00_00415 [Oscillospiraceae bacterium]|nr:hypothetical protein [Oscillospiraceae bacterium]